MKKKNGAYMIPKEWGSDKEIKRVNKIIRSNERLNEYTEGIT